MPSIVLSDDFSGATSTIYGRPLDIASGWMTTWDSASNVRVNNGYAEHDSPTTTNSVSVFSSGVSGNTDNGIYPPIEVTFVIRTPPNLANIDGVAHGGVQLFVHCGGVETSVRIWGYLSGPSIVWEGNINVNTDLIITPELSASTDYTCTLRIADGLQKFTFLGHELTATNTFVYTCGLAKIQANVFGYSKLGGISVSTLMETATFDFSLPRLQSEIYLGSSIDFSLPSIIGGVGVFSLDATLPSIIPDINGHNSTGENDLSFSVPSLLIESNSGAQLSASLSPIALDFGMTGTALITVDVSLPTIDLDSGGLGSPYTVSADFELPRITSEADFGAYVDIAFSSMTVEASVTSGGVVSLDVTIPAVTLDCAGTATSYGSIVFTLPAIAPGAGITADFSIPSFVIDSYVSATITATYEAYAVNLNHADPNASDETTRYTNFPFTHVVRYKNSYYGVNTTGLYLLDGTTDAGAAIPFDVKTAMTDFKSPTKKTLASAYFSGRFGPASTITLTAGEDTPAAYSFSTPRDQAAQNHRQVFGKGLRERYYQLAVAGTGTLELDGIEIDVKNLSRRI